MSNREKNASDHNSNMPFLKDEFSKIFKDILRLGLKLKVDVGDLLELLDCNIILRKIICNKIYSGSLPTARG